jgi:hypothetical protein
MNARTFKIFTIAAALTLLVPAPARADGATVLTNGVAEGTRVVVVINGAHREGMQMEGYGEITDEVHPGRNTAMVRWTGPVQRIDFRITHSTSPNHAGDVLVVRVDAAHDPALRRAGSRTYTFTIPR